MQENFLRLKLSMRRYSFAKPALAVALLFTVPLTANIAAAQETKETEKAKPTVGRSYPFTLLVMNKENNNVFVYPPSAVAQFQKSHPIGKQDRSFAAALTYIPMPTLSKTLHTETEVNSLAKPLGERSAIYAQAVLKQMKGYKLTTSASWNSSVLKVVQRIPSLDISQKIVPRKLKWPPTIPLQLTEIASKNGVLLVIEARNNTTAGVLEKLDFMAFEDGKMTRTYWSRDMHDPTLFQQTDKVINQVTRKFVSRLGRKTVSEIVDGTGIRLAIKRTVDESKVSRIQSAIQKSLSKPKLALYPVKITRDHVIYDTTAPAVRVSDIKEAILSVADSLVVTKRPGPEAVLDVDIKP